MSVFSNIDLEWKGDVYTIAADRVMKAIAVVEAHITVPEFLMVSVGRHLPLSRLCAAYGAVLRYAGARVTDEEVYENVFAGGDVEGTIVRSVNEIMTLMLPARTREQLDGESVGAGASVQETGLGKSRATTAASSSKPTKRRSRSAGG
jgi:hypothetical protein